MMLPFRDKIKDARRKRLIRIALFAGCIIALFAVGFISWLGGFFHSVGRPLWKAENTAAGFIASSSYIVRTKASVFAENDTLQKEIADLRLRMTDYDLLKSENEQLKNLLGRLPSKHSFTLGAILSKPNRSPYDTIIIDVGQDVGLEGDERVFANGEIPIGYISTVYAHTALTILYSSPEEKIEAQLAGSNATVELTGRGGGNFEMSIPRDLPADRGMPVVLPSMESLVIATVEDIISQPTDPLKKILLRSPVNIQELKWVEVKRN